MGTFVWLYSPRTNSSHFIMNSFVVFATLLASACAAPQTLVNTVNKGPQTGPLTALVGGDLVQTPKGLRSLALEGFSDIWIKMVSLTPLPPPSPHPFLHLLSALFLSQQQHLSLPKPPLLPLSLPKLPLLPLLLLLSSATWFNQHLLQLQPPSSAA